MGVNSRCVSLTGYLVLFLAAPVAVDGSIRPSFEVDQASWNATHIVLVETTAVEGVFSVVESWKGDLKPRESVEIPELKPKENALAIARYPKDGDNWEIGEQIPKQPIGSRLIVFLKKQRANDAETPARWGPASGGDMKVSTLWIEDGKAFCFQQSMNLGPSALGPCIRSRVMRSDIAVFTTRIQEVLQLQKDLTEALALKNTKLRAPRLGRIALSDVYQAQNEAMNALANAGTVALPEILQVMDKPAGFYDGDALIHMFVVAAGKESGKQLDGRLQQDVIYWKTVGPTLTKDWLDQLIEVGSPLFMKFNETSLLVRELNKEHYTPAVQAVAELRSYWTSQPQLYDSKWGADGKNGEVRSYITGQDTVRSYAFGLAKDCDAFLKSVGRKH